MTAIARPPWIRSPVGIAWALVALCVVIILFLGSAHFGTATRSSAHVLEFLQWLLPDWRPWERLRLYYNLRTFGHVIEYAVLGALAFRAVFLTLDTALARIAGLAMTLVLLVSVADESRQAFLDERTGSPLDVALDVSGALAAIGLAILYSRHVLRRRTPPPECSDP